MLKLFLKIQINIFKKKVGRSVNSNNNNSNSATYSSSLVNSIQNKNKLTASLSNDYDEKEEEMEEERDEISSSPFSDASGTNTEQQSSTSLLPQKHQNIGLKRYFFINF